jgi:glycosyltransferase involved in cell wall biosynthesis
VRVLHVAQPADGGVPRVMTQLVADQLERDFDVTVAGPRDTGTGAAHVTWEATRSPGTATAHEIRTLARALRNLRPDVVHLHSSKAGLAGRLAVRGSLATVFQPHAWSWDAVTGPLRIATIGWERLGARWAHAVVCVSEGERAAGEAAGVRGRFVVIPNGVDLQWLQPADDAERRAARERLSLGPEPLVVCVGRLSRQKGQDVLLDAWPSVRAAVPDARLVLVGNGPERAALESRNVPGAELVGARDDVPDWLAAATVVVLPSRWEGMSLAMLEAMARARGLVVTDVAGAEAVRAAGGAVVPPGEPGPLAQALEQRLRDPAAADEEGRKARATVEARYALRTTLDAVVELYRSL